MILTLEKRQQWGFDDNFQKQKKLVMKRMKIDLYSQGIGQEGKI